MINLLGSASVWYGKSLCAQRHQDSACGFTPIWHFAHDNLPYHTTATPNNKYYQTVYKWCLVISIITYLITYPFSSIYISIAKHRVHCVLYISCFCHPPTNKEITKSQTGIVPKVINKGKNPKINQGLSQWVAEEVNLGTQNWEGMEMRTIVQNQPFLDPVCSLIGIIVLRLEKVAPQLAKVLLSL